MIHPATVKLGRLARPPGAKFLKLRDYVVQFPEPPEIWDGSGDGLYPMLANDHYGDCTIAGLAHLLSMQAANEGRSLLFADDQVVDYYLQLSGGVDSGLVEVDVLEAARTVGFPAEDGVKLAGWAAVNPKDTHALKSACVPFHGLYIGVGLPIAAQHQEVWDVPEGEQLVGPFAVNSWGGHCVCISGYDATGVTLLTWGTKQRATWAWLQAYCEEAYVALDAERQYTLEGFNYGDLISDLQALGGST